MNLRDRVEDELVQYAIRMESPIIASTATNRYVDAILTAVREALLAPEAVEVFVAVTGFDYEGSVRNGLTAALDAAFGTEADDE